MYHHIFLRGSCAQLYAQLVRNFASCTAFFLRAQKTPVQLKENYDETVS